MPLPFFYSSSGSAALWGAAYSRVKGLFLSGTLGTTNTGPTEAPAGIALIQPALVCSTVAAGAAQQLLSTARAAVMAANYIYIPQSTGLFSASATTAGDMAPPQSGMGAAIVWNTSGRNFMVWSSQHDWVSQLTSVGGGYFSSS